MDIFAWPLLLALAFYIVNLRSRVALLVLVSRRLKKDNIDTTNANFRSPSI